MMHTAYIGLGSNLDQPIAQIMKALRALDNLPNSFLLSYSSIYSSDPMGDVQQEPYVNAVAKLSTQYSPIELLDQLQAIEQSQARVRIERWGPRTIDLDLLLFDHTIMTSERLTIPHYGLKDRDFVVVPLLEIAPTLRLPDGTLLEDCMSNCADYNATIISTGELLTQ